MFYQSFLHICPNAHFENIQTSNTQYQYDYEICYLSEAYRQVSNIRCTLVGN